MVVERERRVSSQHRCHPLFLLPRLPSTPYSSASDVAPETFMKKRCPSWSKQRTRFKGKGRSAPSCSALSSLLDPRCCCERARKMKQFGCEKSRLESLQICEELREEEGLTEKRAASSEEERRRRGSRGGGNVGSLPLAYTTRADFGALEQRKSSIEPPCAVPKGI